MAQNYTNQLPLFDGVGEAETYHNSAQSGFFSLLVQMPAGNKSQSSYPLTSMPAVLGLIDPNKDTWLTQAEFMRPNRRVVNLLRLGLLFVDIDTYKMDWAQGKSPEALVQALLYFCNQEGVPEPSLVVFSGRGLQAKWLLSGTLPRQALPRWNACQRNLVDRLAVVGADPAAKDASRVLRLVDTVNTKSGNVCRVIHVNNDADGQIERYNFEHLAEILLPVARWDLEKKRQSAKASKLKLVQGGRKGSLRGFSGRQLAWDRLEDLRQLTVLRGGVEAGERMKHLFWRLNFLLLSGATNSGLMYHEAAALAQELDSAWSYRSPELMTLYSKAKAHEAGEKVEFAGKSYPALYTPKNDTLISLFQITDDEQGKLKTVISTAEAAKRHCLREQRRRRAAGAIDRETYEGNSVSCQKPWEALRMSRASWYRAGKPEPGSETSPCVLQPHKVDTI